MSTRASVLRSMLAPDSTMPTVLPARVSRSFRRPARPGRARPLDQGVGGRQDESQRVGDLGVGHGHEAGEPLAQGPERERVGVARGQAVGERVGRGLRDGSAQVPRVVDRGGARGLHPVDGHARLHRPGHGEPAHRLRAAAHREDERLDPGLLLEHLQGQGPRARRRRSRRSSSGRGGAPPRARAAPPPPPTRRSRAPPRRDERRARRRRRSSRRCCRRGRRR